MAQKESTTAKRPTAHGSATGIPMGYFGRALLYVSLICILNTLFFIPVPASLPPTFAGVPLENGVPDDPDNSLLELVLEDCFDAPESSSDTQDDVDDVLKKVVYVLHQFACQLWLPATGELPKKHVPLILLVDPAVGAPTPPPERIAWLEASCYHTRG